MTTTKTAKRRTRKTRPVQPETPEAEQASAEQGGKQYQRCPQVVQIPEGCPRCGSTRPAKIGNTTPRALRGTVQGREFNLVTWRHCICSCGQHYRTRTYDLIPE